MNYYHNLQHTLDNSPLNRWAELLCRKNQTTFSEQAHGKLAQWCTVIDSLPSFERITPRVHEGAVTFQDRNRYPDFRIYETQQILKQLHPWRKGPYWIHGIALDAEWRSDLKWNRLAQQIQPLQDRVVLDVGCGNGYHCWRMALEGARLVIGIDPYMLSVVQFHAINHFSLPLPLYVLALGIEDIPVNMEVFDTVFSMGVLYHRRSPIDHLLDLKGCLRSGGELILETLVIDGREGEVLVPQKRYAKMRNIWFIASPQTLTGWLRRCGFVNVRHIDTTRVTSQEQRRTAWMQYESLEDFLDPHNPLLTCEGLSAPRRGLFIAEKP